MATHMETFGVKAAYGARRFAIAVGLLGALGLSAVAQPAPNPAAVPHEDRVVVYGPSDAASLAPLFKGFEKKYPGIRVEYTDLNNLAIYNRMISEAAAKGATADFSFTNAIDLHFSLVKQGLSAQYASPELPNLKENSSYDNSLYALYADPICNFYNVKLLDKALIPTSRAEFPRLILDNLGAFKGKIGSYDIEKVGVGFLQLDWESKRSDKFWETMEAFGKANIRLLSSVSALVDAVGSGELLFAYNLPCSVGVRMSRTNANIGIHHFNDYALVGAMVGMISKSAKHPKAARLLLDYYLSDEAQQFLADYPGRISTRRGITGTGFPTETIANRISYFAMTSSSLEENSRTLDPNYRSNFLRKWKAAVRN